MKPILPSTHRVDVVTPDHVHGCAPPAGGRAHRFVLTYQYGELVEGWQETRERMARAILRQDRAEVAKCSQEIRDWSDLMQRCPMFVHGVDA